MTVHGTIFSSQSITVSDGLWQYMAVHRPLLRPGGWPISMVRFFKLKALHCQSHLLQVIACTNWFIHDLIILDPPSGLAQFSFKLSRRRRRGFGRGSPPSPER